jgi:uncharacterized membrane protein YbhN (UPF0104 family)
VKKHWANILRILVSVGALLFLFWQIGLGETLEALGQADWRYLFIAFLLYVFGLVVRAYRWLVLLRGLDPTVPFGRLLHLYFVGQFFSSFLPSQFGGDVVRALELTQDTDSSASVGTVFLDRMTGLLVLFGMGLVSLPFFAARMEPWLVWLLLAVAGGGLIAGALLLEGRVLRRLTGWLPASLSLAGQGPLAEVYAAVTGCGRWAVMSAFGVSLVFNLINIVTYWLCAEAVETGIHLGTFFVVTPLIAVAGLIPSIGGWGVREAVGTAIFAPMGVDQNVAAALGVMVGLVTLAAGLIGGVLYGIEGLRGLRARR